MKVALLSHLASPTAPTGAERSLALLAAGLAAGGHETAVAAPGPWALAAELETAGVPVVSLPIRCCWLVQWGPQPHWRQAIRALRFALPDPGAGRLRRWLSEVAPDVVHINCLPHVRGAGTAARLGLPVVWHVREMLPPGARRRWFAARLRSTATRIVAVSEAVAEWLRAEGLGELVDVVYNGVAPPPHPIDGERARRQFDLPPEAVVVGLFGQLVAHKGALDLVRAAHLAAAERQDLRVVIAGHGPTAYFRMLEREIAGGAAAERIHLLPPQPDIWELLAAVDVVAMTTVWPDPLPRAVMEAMAAGRAVVAYANGGVPEMVIDRETGLLCPPGDVGGLKRALLELARNRSLRLRLGRAGLQRARDLFSVERHLRRMAQVLQRSI